MSPKNGNRAGEGAGDSVGITKADAAENSLTPTLTQAPDRLVVESLVRQHRIRCIAIGPDRGRP